MEITAGVEFHDFHPELGDFRQEVCAGLSREPKQIPPKFFYDKHGSELFEQICELEEYYPTRTETEILTRRAPDIAARLCPRSRLIEYGSGNSRKVRILLDAMQGRLSYVAIDISKQHLMDSASELAAAYPELEVIAVCADYSKPFPLPKPRRYAVHQSAVFFPGSTIGNFSPEQALEFLRNTAALVGAGGSLLIGVDLKKDPARLDAAYNDARGVTAEFNLNLLTRMNRELDADFDVSAFRHQAFYDAGRGRVEMHLVSLKDQTVGLNGSSIRFREGETIHTENSYKFSIEEFHGLAARASFESMEVWTDPDRLFSLHYLTVAD